MIRKDGPSKPAKRKTYIPDAAAVAFEDMCADKMDLLFATAMRRQGVWPSDLFNGLRKAGLSGQGLLICAIDARSRQEGEVQLQAPLFKEPMLKPLCKMLEGNPSARKSNRDLWASSPGAVTFCFFFIPTWLWKSTVQQSLNIQVSRQALKSKDQALILACFFVTPKADEQLAGGCGKVLLAQHHIMRPGAAIPKGVAAKLTEQKKASLWDIMRPKFPDDIAVFILSCVGLDEAILKDEPLFQELQREVDRRFHDWMRDCQSAQLMAAWDPDAAEVADAVEKLWRDIGRFFMVEKLAETERLWDIMGADRAFETLNRIFAQERAHTGQVERYVQHLGQHVARPCPACGMPLPSTGYPCGCQRPTLQVPEVPANSRPPTGASAADKLPKDRRKKNIQTSFGNAALEARPKHNHKQPQSNDASRSIPAAQSKTSPPNTAHRPGKQAKRAGEEGRATVLSRAQVSHHPPQELYEDGCKQQSSSSMPKRSRRSRRALPQGDRKLALKLAADELLFDGHDPKPPPLNRPMVTELRDTCA